MSGLSGAVSRPLRVFGNKCCHVPTRDPTALSKKRTGVAHRGGVAPRVLSGAGLQRTQHQRQGNHQGAVVGACGQLADRGGDSGSVDAEQLGGDVIAVVLGQHVTVAGQAVGQERRRSFRQRLASLH